MKLRRLLVCGDEYYYKTEDGRFAIEKISYASGARHVKTIGHKYRVEDRDTNRTYKTDTLKDAKWWIQEQLKAEDSIRQR